MGEGGTTLIEKSSWLKERRDEGLEQTLGATLF